MEFWSEELLRSVATNPWPTSAPAQGKSQTHLYDKFGRVNEGNEWGKASKVMRALRSILQKFTGGLQGTNATLDPPPQTDIVNPSCVTIHFHLDNFSSSISMRPRAELVPHRTYAFRKVEVSLHDVLCRRVLMNDYQSLIGSIQFQFSPGTVLHQEVTR